MSKGAENLPLLSLDFDAITVTVAYDRDENFL